MRVKEVALNQQVQWGKALLLSWCCIDIMGDFKMVSGLACTESFLLGLLSCCRSERGMTSVWTPCQCMICAHVMLLLCMPYVPS